MNSTPLNAKVCLPPAVNGNATWSPCLNVLGAPFTTTVTEEVRVDLYPLTETRSKYVPASPRGFTPHDFK